jgi:hypothetical protein
MTPGVVLALLAVCPSKFYFRGEVAERLNAAVLKCLQLASTR